MHGSTEKQTASTNALHSTINVIGLDYYETKIDKLKSEKKSDMATMRLMKIFGGLMAVSGVLGILKILNTPIYIAWPITVLGVLFIIAGFSNNKQISLETEITTLERQKNRVQPKEDGKTNRHFDTLVDINLRNLEDYYELVKSSNRKSFNASLTVSILGFTLITGGLVVSYIMDGAKDITYIAAAAGIIVEIVAGLMFYLYSRTILQLKEYHDSLLNVQNMLLSFKLFEDHKSNNDSSEILKQMIEYLLRGKQV